MNLSYRLQTLHSVNTLEILAVRSIVVLPTDALIRLITVSSFRIWKIDINTYHMSRSEIFHEQTTTFSQALGE